MIENFVLIFKYNPFVNHYMLHYLSFKDLNVHFGCVLIVVYLNSEHIFNLPFPPWQSFFLCFLKDPVFITFVSEIAEMCFKNRIVIFNLYSISFFTR